MSLDTILDRVVAIVDNVSNVGPVLKYARYVTQEKDLEAVYTASGVLRPWIVTGGVIESRDLGPQYHRDRYQILIEGIRAVASDTDSESALQIESEAIRAALNDETNRLLSGDGRLVTPCTRREFNSVMFMGKVLCWHVVLITHAEEKLSQ